jgi:hypothetical protein
LAWTTELVDGRQAFDTRTRQMFVVDAAGNTHMVYGGSHLYYAWQDQGVWHTEIVDSDPAQYPALALDASGKPNISYRSGSQLKLVFRQT